MSFIKRIIKNVQANKKAQLEIDAMLAKSQRRGGTPTTKVYRCGICGKPFAKGQNIISLHGMVMCPEHNGIVPGHLSLGGDIYECPSCGYKFAQGWNEDYYKQHKCSNCGTALNESSWK